MQKYGRDLLYKVSVSAMCVAMGVVLRFFEIMLPLGGANTCRITLEGVFLAVPAFLFGPLFGFISGGIMDVICCLLKPQGAYIPLLTLTAALLGFLRAVFFKAGGKMDIKALRTTMGALFGALLILGISSFIFVPFGDKNTVIAITATAVGALGLIGFAVSFWVQKGRARDFLRIFAALFAAGMIISVINTFILYFVYFYGSKTGLLIFTVARLVENTAECLVVSAVLSFIFPLFEKTVNKFKK
ncbi:MAG: ECF transporter S component [Oscillospiraceae bacterium]|nr:ECF transporter S component [Candidatus Equicaccousia limihippi]